MPSYGDYIKSVEYVQQLLVQETLKPMAFEIFEQERGIPVSQVLPGDNEEFTFECNNFSGLLLTEQRRLYNPRFNEMGLTVNQISASPERLVEIGEELYTAWEEVFGPVEITHQPNHPGEPPFAKTEYESIVERLVDQRDLLCADPQLPDLVNAIQEKNYRLAMRFLGAENYEQVLDPSIGHELYNLFSNGDIHVVYSDSELALLKPEYNDALRREQIRQRQQNAQQGERFRVVVEGELPEEAFVVGRDDTPTGLFAHSVDGTRLSVDQSIQKSYIRDVMGFDRNYRNENRLELDIGERVRLQGDLAIEYVNGQSVNDAGRCPIPIDNHYAALDKGTLPENESKDVEPIRVRVPDGAYLNIAHDEHENVAVELAGGEYELYLLTRGLQPESERPQWDGRRNQMR